MSFFDSLNFTSSNEDGRTELAALAGGGRLACLTGSGTRPLDMLLSDADEVVAVDLNPFQNELLRLKVAAISVLDHDELLAYLGIRPSDRRMALHARVSVALSASSAEFWSGRRGTVEKGVWYAGRWEKVLRIGAFALRLARGSDLRLLFDARDISEQRKIWRDRFDDRLWRGSIRLLSRRWIWTKIVGEPGGGFLPSPAEVERKFAEAFDRAAGSFLFRTSEFASLMLLGRNSLPEAVPMHLRSDAIDVVRERLGRLRIVDGGLHDLAGVGIDRVDAFSLSDFGSYCDSSAYAECWNGVVAVATPGARFCERVLLNDMPIPSASVRLDEDLSRVLTSSDRAVIYDVRAGRIGERT